MIIITHPLRLGESHPLPLCSIIILAFYATTLKLSHSKINLTTSEAVEVKSSFQEGKKGTIYHYIERTQIRARFIYYYYITVYGIL
jgi:hypothetical protein